MPINGIAEVKAGLAELEKSVAKKILRKGLRAGAKLVLTEARADAPVKSGLLRKNVKIRSAKGKKGTVAINVGVGSKDFAGETFYGGFVLYGHKVGSRKLGATRADVPANNFLGEAFEKTKEAAVDVAIATWGELIQQAAANGGKL